MKELVVISGKGGTGKTSLVAAFASLAKRKVLADCDVDAADLHLVLEPKIRHTESFTGGCKARVLSVRCAGCGRCQEVCRFDAIEGIVSLDRPSEAVYLIDPISCEGCGVCVRACPERAITFESAVNGEWYISDTRLGPMVHARLGIAEENSGKLVTLVRNQAKRLAEEQDLPLVVIDGAPGIGCPVIASITGADLVLVVTEPTLSGRHDMKRVTKLTKHFGTKTLVCINKWDLNPEIANQIEEEADSLGVKVIGKMRYDNSITRAQIAKLSVVEHTEGGVTEDIRSVWECLERVLG